MKEATEGSNADGAKDARFAPPAVSLAKGGGAIRGIGEKFAANPVNGTGALTIPLPLSPGRSGFTPAMALSYDSGAGNGPYGFGWSVGYPAITRRTDRGLPRYLDHEESDVFILSGAEDLVPVLSADGSRQQEERDGYRVARYRPRIEGLFARIERWTSVSDTADTFWRSITRDNVATFYGKNAAGRIADPDDAGRIFTWLACESFDDKGNAAVYEYAAEDGTGVDATSASERNRTDLGRVANRYLKRVKYGNRTPRVAPTDLATMEWLFELVMDYGDHEGERPDIEPTQPWRVRVDPISTCRSGFEVRTYRRCQRVLMFHRFAELGPAPRLVRALALDYDDFTYPASPAEVDARAELAHQGSTRAGSILRRATAVGFADSGLAKSMPPLELTYARPVVSNEVRALDEGSYQNLPEGVDGTKYHFVDLASEGLSGVLTEQGGAWWYKPNLGDGQLGTNELVAASPSIGLGDGAQFLDLNGDGALRLVQLRRPIAGYFTHDDEVGEDDNLSEPDGGNGGDPNSIAPGWSSFTPFKSQPNLDFGDPNLRLVDLTGDGFADILITEDDVLRWHPSLGLDGFGARETLPMAADEARGPRAVFADTTQTMFLADVSGDGLTDLVRVRNGEICYWPNLGYGRFGAKVTMDGAPVMDAPELFDPRRVRLGDVDGSGTVDLIYLGADGVRLYFNRAGNGWTPALRLASFPPVDNAGDIQIADLLGNGTACLVWSSPLPGEAGAPLRFVDLMGGQKPHLLVGIENNLGARTTIEYAPSTRFYLADEQAGRPWITRLPFPVHVVARTETNDDISHNRFVTRYAYHHGYYDGVEREFRGFGMVEQTDTEEFAALVSSADPAALPPANVDLASHVPPVLTRTWFHTGIYLGRDRVSRLYAGSQPGGGGGEYYREPGLDDAQAAALLLDDTVLPEGLTTDEEREACRSLKGAMLRQEVYALDGSDRQPHPYATTQQSFTLRMLQGRGSNPHAVFFTHPREVLGFHYERVPEDPRITHALTLEVDAFGNVVKSASVVYGRRRPDPTLEARDQDRQAARHVVYSENDVTNAIDEPDAYRTPLPAAARSYELTGPGFSVGTARLRVDDLRAAVAGAGVVEISYEEAPTSGVLQRRLVEHVRTLYRGDDLAGPLLFGKAQALGLPFESYKLAFTPGLVVNVYGARMDEAMLSGEGGYVHLGEGTEWWIPSGRVFFSPDATDDATVEAATARAHFFVGRRFRDPFGNTTSVTFDTYDLLPLETRDALDNRTTVGERDAAGNVIVGGHDYRVLGPALLTDPNGNRTAARFDALGMPVGTAVMGKRDEVPRRGDLLDGFAADLADDLVAAHLADPIGDPMEILGRATTRLVYDLFAYRRTKQAPQPSPAVVYTLTRETHDADLAPGTTPKVQHAFTYSDGFGREIQKKAQAEPGPVPLRDPATGRIVVVDGVPAITDVPASPRWVGSGWTVFDNKGHPVRQFEPFFTDTQGFEADVRVGVSPILCYDPVGRAVATVHPDHTWEKVVFDPWRQESWDVNDTVLIAEPRDDSDVGQFLARLEPGDVVPTWFAARQAGSLGADARVAARKTSIHAATPSVAHLDSLGRTFLTIAHNRFKLGSAASDAPPTEEHYATRVELDIEGNQRAVTDALDRVVMRYDYDLLGHRIHQASMEAGERWTLPDVAAQPLYSWNSRGFRFRTAYDVLRRPVQSFVQGADPQSPAREILFGTSEYGEGQPDDVALNLRGRASRQRDTAGVVVNLAHDFKGNLLATRRQLPEDYKTTPDWAGSPALETEVFESRTTYDALNRPSTVTTPDASVYRPTFNEGNLLERIEVNLRGAPAATTFVTNIDYDAKGQRQTIEYGNGVRTDYTYDRLTCRLIEFATVRHSDGAVLQDLRYTFDPIGNITQIRDGAQQTIYFNNQVVTPDNGYVYDAIYRLINADGREHIGQAGHPETTWDDRFRVNLPQPGDGQAMRRYGEEYRYDGVGNFLAMVHQAENGNWTRDYAYEERSLLDSSKSGNRLSRTTVGSNSPTAEPYSHDAHGNMTSMPHLTRMQWDFRDQLAASARQSVVDGTPETTYYVYDGAGQRVRKVTKRANGTRAKERRYFGGLEVYREYDGSGTAVTLERETLHVRDDQQRAALVETQTVAQGAMLTVPQGTARYQLGSHLTSTTIELDDGGRLISYEEYCPYGATSNQLVAGDWPATKRYRYISKERDDETGFACHGVRFYIPWSARWLSADPEGVRGGINLYCYALSNPIVLRDSSGRAPDDDEPEAPHDAGVRWYPSAARNADETTGVSVSEEELNTVPVLAAKAIGSVVSRGGGVVKVAAGAGGMAAGQALCDTVIGCLVGGPLLVFSADVGGSGLSQIVHGSPQPTVVGQLAGARAQEVEEMLVYLSDLAYSAAREAVALTNALSPKLGRGVNKSSSAPGVSDDGVGGGGNRGPHAADRRAVRTKFSGRRGGAGENDCVYCVTSLVDTIKHGEFIQPGSGYTQLPLKPPFPTGETALEYIQAETGVAFGPRLQGQLRGEGDYVILNQFRGGEPKHILWARVRPNGERHFFDAQNNKEVLPRDVGPYDAYKIDYHPGRE